MIKLFCLIVLFCLNILQKVLCDDFMNELLQSSSTQDKYIFILNNIHFDRQHSCKLAFHNCLYSIDNEDNLKSQARMECYPLWKSLYCLNNKQIFNIDNCNHQDIQKKLKQNINRVSRGLETCNNYFYLSINSSSIKTCSKYLIFYLIFFYFFLK